MGEKEETIYVLNVCKNTEKDLGLVTCRRVRETLNFFFVSLYTV